MFGLASLAPLACGSSGRPQYGAEDEPTFAEDAGDEAQDPSFGEVMPCPQDPGNYDIPGNGCDDDADGVIDNGAGCDDGLPFYGSADDFAKTLGLCKRATGANDPGWGVISASYTRGHASTAAPADGQHGILPTFGDVIKAREGKNLGILSTGWARPYNDLVENQCDALGNGEGTSGKGCFKQGLVMQAGTPVLNATPPGYPKPANGCAVSDQIFDPITVKLTVKVPKNVQGFSVDFDFWSGEWPDYVCTRYNDGFLIYLQSSAFNGGKPENIAFDAKGNALSVNNGFFDRCTANTPARRTAGRAATPAPATGRRRSTSSATSPTAASAARVSRTTSTTTRTRGARSPTRCRATTPPTPRPTSVTSAAATTGRR